MSYMYFLEPIQFRNKEKSKREKLKEFVYKMKMMGLEKESSELVDYSQWGKGNKELNLREQSLGVF